MENKKAISTFIDNVQSIHSRHSEDIKNDLKRIAKEMKERLKNEKGIHNLNILMCDEIADIDPQELNEMGYTVLTMEDIENIAKKSLKKDK